MTLVWQEVFDNSIQQGDYFPDILVPLLPANLDEVALLNQEIEIELKNESLIIVTPTCDLVEGRRKSDWVALCAISTETVLKERDVRFTQKDRWNKVQKGQIKGHYYLRAQPESPSTEAMIILFHQIFSLPFDYITRYTKKLNPRIRLCSPFLESYSRAFGNMYSDVALPDRLT